MPYIGNTTADFSINTGNITNKAVTALKLSPSSVGSNGQVLSVDGSGNLQWASDSAGMPTSGGTFTGNINFNDDIKARFGTQYDLEIFHDHTNQKNVIKNITGSNLPIELAAQVVNIQGVNQSAFSAKFSVTAGQELYFGGTKKFETTNLGAKIAGELQTGGTAGIKLSHTGTTSILETQTAGDDLIFKITPSGGSTTERFSLTTANDVAKFTGSNSANLTIRNDTANEMQIHTGSSDALIFGTNGENERLRITGDGPHLLLGGTADVNEITESSSNTGMVIGSTSVGNGGLAIINSTSGTGRIYFGDATGSDAARNRGQINYYHSSDYMMFATAGAERLRIDSSGRFGINESSSLMANGMFTVKLDTDKHIAYSHTQSEVGNVPALVAYQDSGSLASLGFRGTDLRFATGSSERLRIDSSGSILSGVGHGSSINVAGNAFGRQIIGTEFTNSGMSLSRFQNGASGPSLLFAHSKNGTVGTQGILVDGDEIGKVRFCPSDGTDFDHTAVQVRALIDGTTGVNNVPASLLIDTWTANGSLTTKVKVRASGDVEISDGNIVMANGHGIDFSATPNSGSSTPSELLDDYEEGEWTPIYTGAGGTVSNTYDHQKGLYTRIGRQVTVNCILNVTASTGASGDLRVEGLPYTAASIDGNEGTMGYVHFNQHQGFSIDTSYIMLGAIVQSNNNYVHFRKWKYDTSSYAAQQYGAGAMNWMRFNLTYAVG